MDALRGLRRHNLPRDLTDLPVVHGVEDRGVAHPLADPQLDADAGVEEQHGCQGEQEKSHHDEGGVGLPVGQRAPTLLTAHVVVVVQEVVFHLWEEGERKASVKMCAEAPPGRLASKQGCFQMHDLSRLINTYARA